MARQLRAQGEAVGLLAVLDERSNPGQARAPFRPTFLVEFLKNLPRWVWYDLCQSGLSAMLTRLRLRVQGVLTRPPRQRDGRGTAPGAAAHKAGEVFDLARLPESYRKLLEYHYQLVLEYQPQAYAGRVTLLRAKAQPLSRLQAGDLGWSELAGGGVEVIAVPGSHDYLLKEPYVGVLAQRLGACLQKAQAAVAPRTPFTPAPSAPLTEGPAAAGAATPSHEKPQVWRVVINDEGQYSLWPSDRAEPPGWTDAGRGGSRDECLAFIRAVWDDRRPLSRKSSRPESDLVTAPALTAGGAG
jgi:MbtH protein